MTKFYVEGIPAPQGSKNGYIRGGRVVLVESSKKVKPWREQVARVAKEHCGELIDGPVSLELAFFLPRPKSLPKAVKWMVKKPDLDKLVRSTCDALSGSAYVDDNRVVELTASKAYAPPGVPTGCLIRVMGTEEKWEAEQARESFMWRENLS